MYIAMEHTRLLDVLMLHNRQIGMCSTYHNFAFLNEHGSEREWAKHAVTVPVSGGTDTGKKATSQLLTYAVVRWVSAWTRTWLPSQHVECDAADDALMSNHSGPVSKNDGMNTQRFARTKHDHSVQCWGSNVTE